MRADRFGLQLTTNSDRAVREYVTGLDLLLSAQPGGEEAFDRALEADPDFALGHAARARVLQMRGAQAEARQTTARAAGLAASATPREQRHVSALALALEPDLARALEFVRAHLRESPRDALVLSLLTGVYSLTGFSGRVDRNELLLEILEEVAPAFGEDWWFLNVHAFACTEAGDRKRGRALVERALALNPRNAHAAHALAHVFYEEDDSAGGSAFVAGWIPGYAREAQLHCHLSWHLALFELDLGRVERAVAIYEDGIRPGVSRSTAIGTLVDSASLLWRCGLWSVGPSPLPWDEVRDFAARALPRPTTAFADAHVAAAFAAAGDRAALDARLAELRSLERDGRQAAGKVAGDVAEGMAAFAEADHARAIERLGSVFEEIVRIGGSRAQRDVFEQTLLSAYLRAGRVEDARTLFRRRLEGRPAIPGHPPLPA